MDEQQIPERKISVLKILAIIGDITSITGISLLYLTQIKGMNLNTILIIKTIVYVVVAFGYLLLTVTLLVTYFRQTAKNNLSWLVRITIFVIVFPIYLGFAVNFAGVTAELLNRLVDNISQGKSFAPALDKNMQNTNSSQ